jgi:hypothetical protein
MSLSKQSQSQSHVKVLVDHSGTNSNLAKGVSLCIARVFNNINYWRIKEVFIRMNWGFVERVDVVQLRGFKRAYVHFEAGKWNVGNAEAMAALEAMKRCEPVHITYDDPWYWKLGISRSARAAEAPKPKPKPLVTIGKALGREGVKKVVCEKKSEKGEEGEV